MIDPYSPDEQLVAAALLIAWGVRWENHPDTGHLIVTIPRGMPAGPVIEVVEDGTGWLLDDGDQTAYQAFGHVNRDDRYVYRYAGHDHREGQDHA
ncbi:MAG: hypothetical protein ACK5LO_02375 [Leucobacter sp.]